MGDCEDSVYKKFPDLGRGASNAAHRANEENQDEAYYKCEASVLSDVSKEARKASVISGAKAGSYEAAMKKKREEE